MHILLLAVSKVECTFDLLERFFHLHVLQFLVQHVLVILLLEGLHLFAESSDHLHHLVQLLGRVFPGQRLRARWSIVLVDDWEHFFDLEERAALRVSIRDQGIRGRLLLWLRTWRTSDGRLAALLV